MMLNRSPAAPLRPFVETLWVVDRAAAPPAAARERVLPTGSMHLAFSLSGEPFRVAAGNRSAVTGPALVGGARSRPYVRHLDGPSVSVGALLRAGACEYLFGVPAGELAERHTPLDELWGVAAEAAFERLAAAPDAASPLAALECLLAGHLPRLRALHPAVAHALERFALGAGVGEVVRGTGYSHRRFIGQFEHAVGLTPKRYCRVLRFRRALTRLWADPRLELSTLAQEAGYSDQAHFSREFSSFAGISPGCYRRTVPKQPYHVSLAE
jgi:AraC-like DNA-binding protein